MLVKLVFWEGSEILLRGVKMSSQKVVIRLGGREDPHTWHMDPNTVWVAISVIVLVSEQQVGLPHMVQHLEDSLLDWPLPHILIEARVGYKEEATAATLTDLYRRPPTSSSVPLSHLLLYELLVKAPVVFPQSVYLSPLVEPDCSVPPCLFSAQINLDDLELKSETIWN